MSWQASLLAIVVLTLACAAYSPGAPGAATVDLGQPFTLKVGAQVTIRSEALRTGFTRVVSDSRCPRGAQCITEGEATIEVWVSKGAGPRTSHELRSSPPGKAEITHGDYHIRLQTLEPYPELDRRIRPSDYVATLIVDDRQH